MNEIYKDIKGYENLYRVSNLGNVLSLAKGDGNGYRDRLLKFDVDKRNHTTYYRVTLSKHGRTKKFFVHQLVAKTFIDNLENKPLVNHIDNCGTNNNMSNLEWSTYRENMLHSSSQGRQDKVIEIAVNAMAETNRKNSKAHYTSMVGTTIGHLTIESYYIDDTLKRPCPKFICKCSCGNTTKNGDQLKHRKLMCNDCSTKVGVILRKQGKDIVNTA